jgi:hypothetical protein
MTMMRSFEVMLVKVLCRIMQFSQCYILVNTLTFAVSERKSADSLFSGVLMREITRRMSDVFSKLSLDMFQTDECIVTCVRFPWLWR